MHSTITLVTTADSSLGRFEENSMSDQCRMEILVEGLNQETKRQFCDNDGNFKDIKDWNLVNFDAEGNVNQITFFTSKCKGDLWLDFLPPFLEVIKVMSYNTKYKIGGTISAIRLPQTLREVRFDSHAFHGSIDFDELPHRLRILDVESNDLSGSCDLTALPQNLEILWLSNNKFLGSVDMRSLPQTLKSLKLSGNNFSGEIQFANLPQSLKYLNIANNSFCGSFVLTEKVQDIEIIAKNNEFLGTAVVSSDEGIKISLIGNAVDRVVDTHGKAHPQEKAILRNRF